jgi:pimeloyl-ACP methyl ester carboxylesterase
MRNWQYAPYILIALLAVVMTVVAWKTYYLAQVIKNTEIAAKHQKFHSKYARAVVQPVTFYAQESRCTNQMIARKGIIFRKPGARATIMICHGFMCNKTDIRFLRMLFHDYNVMIFDFRAHGESKARQLCTFGYNEMHDIIAAAHFIKSDPELGKMPLIAYAFSMGAVSAINAQAHDNSLFDCAVLDCPFDSTDALLDRSIAGLTMSICGYKVPVPGRSLLKKYAYNAYVQELLKFLLKTVANMDSSPINTQMMPIDTVDAIGKVTIPTFFIVCRNDEKAPPHAVKRVYDNAQGYKRFWITNGRHHFDSFFYDPEKYAHKVRRFVEKYLDERFVGKIPEKMYQDAPEIEKLS